MNSETANGLAAKIEELLLKKLGAKSCGRVHHFRNYYSSGWGDGNGKPLSPRALENFYAFLEAANFPARVQPSVFLTDHGSMELSWEDSSGKAIQFEFRANEIEFYVESSDREGVVPANEAKELARRSVFA